jgi:ABC-2 type transport system ATP-binding protein
MSRSDAADAANHWLDRLGLHERKSDPVEKLSLGNQQRVQLAAALVHDPVLLILDEPFSSLDPTGVDALSEILLERAGAGVPVVFSSHQLELVERLCDAVAIIDAGQLVATGTVDELRTRGRKTVLRVDVATDHDWTRDLTGVAVLTSDQDGTLLEIEDDVDDQTVLAAALRAGPVRHFGPERPTLVQLYREVVRRTDPSNGKQEVA